ncbi:MAG: FAD-dependent oxidoreductase [Verrucomicrobia bacterium]|nr:FAD-dependent oxidoreductase [Verrucomicrobiota bacterium]
MIWRRRSFLRTSLAAGAGLLPLGLRPRLEAAIAGAAAPGREARAEVVVIGASLGGVAAALAAARMGRSVLLTEETSWIGGQATAQGVPLDEHPWAEEYGRTRSYAEFRAGVRAYYRRHTPLSAAARGDATLNPGAGWVSKLCFEPRVGLAVLYEMLAPHLASGRVRLWLRHRPVAVALDGDRVRAVTLRDEDSGADTVATGEYFLDGTELGDVLELGRIESVVGAEARAVTGEPLASEVGAQPREQMVFTHVFALEHRPGENHVIARPRDYAFWRAAQSSRGAEPKFTLPDLFGVKQDHFARAVRPGAYVASTWSFRRIRCRENFVAGAYPSDRTVAIWHANEYHLGPLCGVGEAERRQHLAAARQLSLSVIHWLQTEAPNPATGRKGYPGLRPCTEVFDTPDGLAPFPYVREARRLQAEFTVREQHFRTDSPGNATGPVKFADTVGVSGYRVDIHRTARGGGGSITEVAHGKHWLQQIPLGALIPVRVENLLPAGKNLGVTAVTNGAFRVHPTEWNIGESAGAVAAFCLQHNLRPRQVRNTPAHLADFQRELVRQGVELDWPAGRMTTARSYYSHHNLELKDADTFYFGEAWRLGGPAKGSEGKRD